MKFQKWIHLLALKKLGNNSRSSLSHGENKQIKALITIYRHPDKNPGCGQACNEKFDKIHKAYEVLSDPEKKKNYDEVYFPLFC